MKIQTILKKIDGAGFKELGNGGQREHSYEMKRPYDRKDVQIERHCLMINENNSSGRQSSMNMYTANNKESIFRH